MTETTRPQHSPSVADLLDSVDLRGRTWCYVDLSDTGGYSVKPNDAALVHVVLSGRVVLSRSGGEAVRLSAGEGIIVTSGEAHAVRAGSHAIAQALDFLSAEQNVDIPESIRLGRAGHYRARLLTARLRMTWPDGLSRASLPATLLLGQRGVAGEPALDLALLPRWGSGPGATVMLTRLASAILADALRRELLDRKTKDFAIRNPLEEARALVESGPGKNWTVETLARSVGMGRSNFSAQFSRCYGQSPMEFVTASRMKRAAELLRGGNMPIQEISEAVGYGCEPAFHRRFSKHFGVTPGAMRAASTACKVEAEVPLDFSVLRRSPMFRRAGQSADDTFRNVSERRHVLHSQS